MTLEMFLGLFGTVTGSVSLWISWSQWRGDRHDLRMAGSMTASQSIQRPDWHFVVHLALKNHGRRTVKIIQVGMIMEENKWKVIDGNKVFMTESRLTPPGLHPQKLNLEEGDRHDFKIEPFDLAYLAPAREDGDTSITFYAVDSLDREYRVQVEIPDEEHIQSLQNAGKPIAGPEQP